MSAGIAGAVIMLGRACAARMASHDTDHDPEDRMRSWPRRRPRRHGVPYVTALALASLLALGASPPARAIDYLVEVVLFENLGESPSHGDGGLWFPKTGPALALGGETAREAGFEIVERGRSLEESAALIAASGRYRLLGHLAWRQPGLDESEARAVRIGLGPVIDLYLPEDLAPYEDFVPATEGPEPGHERAVRAATLGGTLRVRLGRFLHMEALLVYTDLEAGRSYRLAQSRKMRSRELHYIDNPRFGLLTRILPIEDGGS